MLANLVYPAIKLMNRLSYGYKFLLINILFVLPLIALAYLQLAELSKQQNVTHKELDGIQILRQSLKLTEVAAEIRDLQLIQGNDESLTQEITQQKQQFSQLLDRLSDNSQRLDQDGKVQSNIQKLREQLQERSSYQSTSINVVFNKYQRLVEGSWSLTRQFSQLTGLSRDSDNANFLLMKLTLDQLEPILKHQGQVRSYSAKAIRAGAINSALANALNSLLDALITDQNRLAIIMSPIQSDQAHYGRHLLGFVNAIPEQLEQRLNRFENDLLLEEQLDHDWQTYFEQESGAHQAIYLFIEQAVTFVEQNLQQRFDEQNQNFYMVLIGVVATILITNYLMLGFNLSVRHGLQEILTATEKVAQGDLTCQVQLNSRDELGQFASEFNRMAERMRNLLAMVNTTVASVAEQAESVSHIASQSHSSVDEQHKQIERVASAFNQMTRSAQEIANQTQTASQQSREVGSKSHQGQSLVQNTLTDINRLSSDINQAVHVIHKLEQDSSNITQVLDVIKGIAEQTNLLALNAAIEAARAGEQGRGFAVVADEVRTLAQRTQNSASEIEQMIIQLQEGVNGAVEAMQVSHQKASQTVSNSSAVSETLNLISEHIEQIVDFNSQIASASEEQTMVSNEIERNIHSIFQAASDTASGANDTVNACQHMLQQTQELKSRVSTFKT